MAGTVSNDWVPGSHFCVSLGANGGGLRSAGAQRSLAGTVLAACIVYGLFLGMSALITRDYVKPDTVPSRLIERLTPMLDDADLAPRPIEPPRPIDPATKPPPLPQLSATKSNIDLPVPYLGIAPFDIPGFDRVQPLDLTPNALPDTDARPIRPPEVAYPSRAIAQGIEGECLVTFDVDIRGRPYNVVADCTDSVFERAAYEAVSRVQFAPKILGGQARERRNVVYPLVFTLD